MQVDGFRFIDHLHTTTRQLIICTRLIETLGSKQLPSQLLGDLLVAWSITEEKENQNYRMSRGKLSENGKKTTAFKHYLSLCTSLKLVVELNNFCSNARISHLLIYFLRNNGGQNFGISDAETLFYFVQLFRIDADGLLLVLNLLSAHKSINQKELQYNFKGYYNNRLAAKLEKAPPLAKSKINEKYRNLNYVWQNPEKYSEHILIPRCEWLATLGLVKIEKIGSFTTYHLSSTGEAFKDNLPVIGGSVLDISEEWIRNFIFTSANRIIPGKRIFYRDLNIAKQEELLGETIDKATEVVKSSGGMRIPLFDALLFISMELFLHNHIVIEFNEITIALKKGVIFDKKVFYLKGEARINEGYIFYRLL